MFISCKLIMRESLSRQSMDVYINVIQNKPDFTGQKGETSNNLNSNHDRGQSKMSSTGSLLLW